MYELLKDHKPTLIKLAKKGIIDAVWIRDIEMYEYYLELNTTCIMCKYTIIAEKYGLSEETARKRIKIMQG